eukprot:11166046-Lingulodinium_polyedra.AAC.1
MEVTSPSLCLPPWRDNVMPRNALCDGATTNVSTLDIEGRLHTKHAPASPRNVAPNRRFAHVRHCASVNRVPAV